MEESQQKCFLYDPANKYDWGDCCEELNIVPKPIWLILLLTLPIEAVLAGADVRATEAMYAEKDTRTAWIFVFFNVATLLLMLLDFPWKSCRKGSDGVFECYQGLVFMYFNSIGALATLMVWILVGLRKFFWYMYNITRFIIRPSTCWKIFDTSYETESDLNQAISDWKCVGDKTGLYWYNGVLIAVALILGGFTHVLPGFFMYPWIQCVLILSLIHAHCIRLGYLCDLKKRPQEFKRPCLRSVYISVFVVYPLSLVTSLISLIMLPIYAVYYLGLTALRFCLQCLYPKQPYEAAELVQPMVSVTPPLPYDTFEGTEEEPLLPDLVEGVVEEEMEEELPMQKMETKRISLGRLRGIFRSYVLDALRNMCFYDPDGVLMMFAGATLVVVVNLSANYSILAYSGASYMDIPLIDFNSRSTSTYIECTAKSFTTISAFGLSDVIGLIIGIAAGALEFIDFLYTL